MYVVVDKQTGEEFHKMVLKILAKVALNYDENKIDKEVTCSESSCFWLYLCPASQRDATTCFAAGKTTVCRAEEKARFTEPGSCKRSNAAVL